MTMRVVKGDRHVLEVLDSDNITLDSTYHKCRWYFPDDKARPRGLRVSHTFKKRGRVQPTFRVDCLDGTIYRGYMNIIVLEESSINDSTN